MYVICDKNGLKKFKVGKLVMGSTRNVKMLIRYLTFACPCIVSIIVNDDQQNGNFWFIYLFPIGFTCFGRCFRP